MSFSQILTELGEFVLIVIVTVLFVFLNVFVFDRLDEEPDKVRVYYCENCRKSNNKYSHEISLKTSKGTYICPHCGAKMKRQGIIEESITLDAISRCIFK